MDYLMVAYFNVSQNAIETFIRENEIDRTDKTQHCRIVDYYKETHPELKEANILYSWNTPCKMHDFFDEFSIRFIHEDERFTNQRYHKILQAKHHLFYPDCLIHIKSIYSSKDAILVADALAIFYGDDEKLMEYADWLRTTSKKCSMYELSYR